MDNDETTKPATNAVSSMRWLEDELRIMYDETMENANVEGMPIAYAAVCSGKALGILKVLQLIEKEFPSNRRFIMDVSKQFEFDKMYDLALKIMRKAHKGQFRKDGVTKYEVHSLELADMFDSYLDKVIAVLHDAIEDGADQGVTYEYIREEFERGGFSDTSIIYVMEGLKYLTHDKVQYTYAEYVSRVAVTVYRKFKIADITINLAGSPSDYQKMKYKKAMKILLGVE